LAIAVGSDETVDAQLPAAAWGGREMTCKSGKAVRDGENMKQATSKGLYDYWNAVRGRRLAPRRYEIEPSQIVSFLSETIILEKPDQDGCRVRVAGTRISEWLGFELRGQRFFDLWRAEDRVVLMDNLTSICAHGGVGLFEFEVRERGMDCAGASFEMLLLPLTHLEDQVERVLGSITIMGEQSFAGDISGGVTLISNEIIWPDGRPFRLAHLDRPSGLTPAIDPRMRRARLVRCDRRKFLVYDGGRAGE
jgi:hypothetical protein